MPHSQKNIDLKLVLQLCINVFAFFLPLAVSVSQFLSPPSPSLHLSLLTVSSSSPPPACLLGFTVVIHELTGDMSESAELCPPLQFPLPCFLAVSVSFKHLPSF